jgi:1-deoxy-D-xylulose-5-phosphate reductoisomerase
MNNSERPYTSERPLRIAILGSTGSIGRQALDVVRRNAGAVQVVALAAHTSAQALVAQAREFDVRHLVLGDGRLEGDAALSEIPNGAAVRFGARALEGLAALDTVDLVLNALVGAAGLRASYAALTAGKRLALANKESLVVGGDLLMPLATHDTLLPVDSEHSAIYQCLLGERGDEVSRIWLTASGGPFRGRTRAQLAQVTREDALVHPTWSMGPKITVDSATLMNKGLEVIEAHHLFAKSYDTIRVVVHPQSCVHSMVEYRDGSVKAHLGVTDMRIPIQFALSYPHRWDTPLAPLDFTQLGSLDFAAPDLETFGALPLALAAGRVGGTMPAVLNAANEVAVEAFLARRCAFLDIERVVGAALEQHDAQHVESLEQLEEIDVWARELARKELP